MVTSALTTATDPHRLEFVFYVDNDDDSYDFDTIKALTPSPLVKVVRGPRIVLSKMWNLCWEVASGPFYLHTGDDLVFRTPGWDQRFLEPFDAVPDKILFVHGDDGAWGERGPNFGTHGMIHANWTDTVGYFVPPYFSSDYNDTWLNDVANALGRRRYVNVLTEHMHFAFNKGPLDETHRERLERHARDNVDALYYSAEHETLRGQDVEKLKAFIESMR